MAYENFKPLVWSKHIELELPKFTVFKEDCNFKFQGEVGLGKRVKILGVSRPTIKKYLPNQDIDSPETPSDSSVFLDVDQYDYFNYGVDDVDKAQATEGLMPALSEETTRGLAEMMDSFIGERLAKEAGYITTAKTIATADDAKKAVDDLFVQLWQQGVSTKDKVTLYMTPWFYDLFQNKLVEVKTDNDSLVAKGVLGLYRSAQCKMSNNIFNDGTNDFVVLKTSKAFAFANGVNEMEAYRPERRFSDAIKGLNTYGGKMVRPKECAVLKCKLG